ncbi:uncharacterized protein [Dendropsophus ebraccatus]|uniref:uncharacterized protein n=1 Tax=Dendropsophus ebraccatus TaxID=150705 RepID=UPI0038316518
METSQRVAAEMSGVIQNFSLDGGPHGAQGYSRLLLQLCGLVESGKSMLINSCKYVLEGGDYTMHASDEQTNIRKTYQLTPNITIADNRGIPRMDYINIATVYAQLGSFCPLDEPVERFTEYDALIETIEETDLDPNYTDLTVPVFVYRGAMALHENAAVMTSFLRGCRVMTGISPIIVITNKNSQYAAQLEREFQIMGAEHVVLLENYTREDHMKTLRKDTDILTFLHSALQDAIYRMQQQRDSVKERTERKKFLIKYMHKEVVTKEIENLKRSWRT